LLTEYGLGGWAEAKKRVFTPRTHLALVKILDVILCETVVTKFYQLLDCCSIVIRIRF